MLVADIKLFIVCVPVHVLAFPKFKPTVLVVEPLYPPTKVRVPSADKVLRLEPRDMPLMVELVRYALSMVEPCQTPVVIVPRLVKEEVTTLDASVVPVNVPAGAMTVEVETAVTRPLPFTVNVGAQR